MAYRARFEAGGHSSESAKRAILLDSAEPIWTCRTMPFVRQIKATNEVNAHELAVRKSTRARSGWTREPIKTRRRVRSSPIPSWQCVMREVSAKLLPW